METRDLANDYILRSLQNYDEFRHFSKFPFTFALTTLQAISNILGANDTRNGAKDKAQGLSKNIEDRDIACKLKKYPFFLSEVPNNDCYWQRFCTLRNASSHILKTYKPINNEIGNFTKVFLQTDKVVNGRTEIKAISSKDLRNFLLDLNEILTNDKPTKIKRKKRKAYRDIFLELIKVGS